MALCNSPTFPKPPRPGGKANIKDKILALIETKTNEIKNEEEPIYFGADNGDGWFESNIKRLELLEDLKYEIMAMHE